MTLEEFRSTLEASVPPQNLSLLLTSMWHDGKGDWHSAHTAAQDVQTLSGSWVHAYLHRKEGDLPNARYWYSMAGKTMPSASLDEEWSSIVTFLLAS